jgi:hypothetical protein
VGHCVIDQSGRPVSRRGTRTLRCAPGRTRSLSSRPNPWRTAQTEAHGNVTNSPLARGWLRSCVARVSRPRQSPLSSASRMAA